MRKPEDVTVLIVEDEPDVRAYLAAVLEDAGMEVVEAGNGSEAMAILERRLPDLISTDLVMPRRSGIRLLHELRKRPAWSRIPVLIVTGHAEDREIGQALDVIMADRSLIGPSSLVEKPVTAQGYLEQVCRLTGVELPEGGAGSADEVALRRQAVEMLARADRSTLEAILARLRRS